MRMEYRMWQNNWIKMHETTSLKRVGEERCWPKSLWKWVVSESLKARGMAHQYSPLVQLSPMVGGGGELRILRAPHVCTGIEQLSKWLADGGSQVSPCWSGKLQTNKIRLIHVATYQSWRHKYELMFGLIQKQMFTYGNTCGWVYIHTFWEASEATTSTQ